MKTLVWGKPLPAGNDATVAAQRAAVAPVARCPLRALPHAPSSIARYAVPALVAAAVHVALLWCPYTPPVRAGHGGVAEAETAVGEASARARSWSELVLATEPAPAASEASAMVDHAPAEILDAAPRPELAAEFLRSLHTESCAVADPVAPQHSGKARWTVGKFAPDNAAIAGTLHRVLADTEAAHQASSAGAGRWGAPTLRAGSTDLLEVTQLDREPALIRVPDFEFPAHLSRQGIHAGRVTVVVRVDARGRVSLLSVAESSHPDLIPAVCAATPKALFQPPVRHGRPVALRYAWTLELKDRTADSARRTL